MSGVVDGFEKRQYEEDKKLQCHNTLPGLKLKNGREQIIVAAKEAELERITLEIQKAYQRGRVLPLKVDTGFPEFIIEKLQKMEFKCSITNKHQGLRKTREIKITLYYKD